VDYHDITCAREDDFAVITMARPERRNALSEAHLRELLHAFAAVGDSEARGVILAAEGPVFCAGHDFADMADRDEQQMQGLLAACRDVMEAIQSIPQPVIAQVEGLATAAGCQLVATCDLAVASQTARFAVPGGKGGWFCTTPGVALARAVGRKRAVEMLLTGEAIDAATAADWGLVNRTAPPEVVPAETRALLGLATRGSAFSKGLGKQAFYRQVELDTAEAYEFATEVMASASQSHDAKEGMRSFVEKRRPRFENR
jgi:enoyl-CoA hydratase/carnithine racemase